MPEIPAQISGKNRILVSIYIVLIALSIYFIISTYLSYLNQTKNHILGQLKSIVCTASLLIDGDQHTQLATTYLNKDDITDINQDESYFHTHQQLKKVYIINKLQSPVYTLVPSKDSSHFEYIVTSADKPYYRHSYVKFPEKMLELYHTGGELGVHESENGIWLSAFAPINNSIGKPVALIQADMPFDQFRKKANNKLITNILIAFLIFSNVGLVLIRYIKRELIKEELLKQDLLEKNKEISEQNERIEKQKEDLGVKNQELNVAKNTIEGKNQQLQSHNLLLDKKVKEKTSELIETNEELSNFLYRSSHDLIGPVASLKGIINLLKNEELCGEMREYFEKLDETVEKLDNTIRNHAFVHELKQQELEIEEINLHELVDEILNNLKPCEQGIKVEMDIPKEFNLNSDKIMMGTIFRELIKNSCQYQCDPSQGQSIIKISGGYHEDHSVFITIEDNGSGISGEIGNKIFDMFYRGNEQSGGQGLGLYMVSFAMKILNGKISFESQPKHGTKFKLTFPPQDVTS